MLVKKGLMTVAFALPMVSSLASAQLVSSVQDLQQMCFEFQNHEQAQPFAVRIVCEGSRTFWQEIEPGQFSMPNSERIMTSAGCKDNRFQFSGVGQYGAGGYISQLAPTTGSCSRHIKTEVATSQPIFVTLTGCEQLDQRYIEEICWQKVAEACEGAQPYGEPQMTQPYAVPYAEPLTTSSRSSSISSEKGGFVEMSACTTRVVDQFDTCTMYGM